MTKERVSFQQGILPDLSPVCQHIGFPTKEPRTGADPDQSRLMWTSQILINVDLSKTVVPARFKGVSFTL